MSPPPAKHLHTDVGVAPVHVAADDVFVQKVYVPAIQGNYDLE